MSGKFIYIYIYIYIYYVSLKYLGAHKCPVRAECYIYICAVYLESNISGYTISLSVAL